MGARGIVVIDNAFIGLGNVVRRVRFMVRVRIRVSLRVRVRVGNVVTWEMISCGADICT